MISAARTEATVRPGGRLPRAAGFTLLEMIVVMAVVALLFAAGFAGYKISNDVGRQLEDATMDLELMARRARTVAALEQRPYGIEFTQGSASLMAYAEALMEPDERSLMLDARAAEAGEAVAAADSVRLGDDGTRVLVQRWGSDQWFDVSRRERQVWRFDPEGLCEPLAVRLETGESWMAVRFHPLTATIADTESDVK